MKDIEVRPGGVKPPIGGKFIARGITPSTFQPLPPPRRMSIPATLKATPDYAVHKAWKRNKPVADHPAPTHLRGLQGPEKLAANNAMQALLRPSGPDTVRKPGRCDYCGKNFPGGSELRRHRQHGCRREPTSETAGAAVVSPIKP